MSAGTPIISPWFFYFIGLTDDLIAIAFIGLFAALLIGALIWYLTVEDSDISADEYKTVYNKCGKKCIAFSILCGLLLIFTPSQETCIQMLLADNITYERLDAVGSSVENIYNDIIAIAEKAVGTTE